LKSATTKKRSLKTAARKASRKTPKKLVKVAAVEDTIVDVIDEPAPGVTRITLMRPSGQFVAHIAPLPSNPYDGHTLANVVWLVTRVFVA